jgi:phenylalanyl-tRNA synthetase alpha chain
VEAETVGKKSLVSSARRSLGSVSEDLRPELGRLINAMAEKLGSEIAAKRLRLETEGDAERLAGETIDVTLPGRVPPRGTHHLITTALEEITDIFVSMGYDVASGPEAETNWYNFTALNIPPDHPARAETDTIHLDFGEPGEVALRPHTSPMQARYMQEHSPPVYVVVPGRVFRREAVDPTHSPVFHQLEGLAVGAGITFADLRGTLEVFANRFFGAGRSVRFLPNYFPFTEPSAELLVSCFACDGSGCRVCSQEGWIELLGCGMVHPAVFEAVGYDPAAVTGFAFGLGVDRFAQVRHGINDLRHFFGGDIRVLDQFR